jgi:hypothetical protein
MIRATRGWTEYEQMSRRATTLLRMNKIIIIGDEQEEREGE